MQPAITDRAAFPVQTISRSTVAGSARAGRSATGSGATAAKPRAEPRDGRQPDAAADGARRRRLPVELPRKGHPGYWTCTPETARAMTRRWISLVPSKMV